MQTQVFLTCCVVVLMAAHAVLAQSALAECYETSNGATFERKHISDYMRMCYGDDRGTRFPNATTPCECAAAAEAQGMNSFKYSVDGSCLLYRGLAENEHEGTMVVYSVTSAPFEPADHEFSFQVPAGIRYLNLRSIDIFWRLDNDCGAVKSFSVWPIVDGIRSSPENYSVPAVRHTLVASDICKTDELAFQCYNEAGSPIGPEVIWVNPRASDLLDAIVAADVTVQLYEGNAGDARCFLTTDKAIRYRDASTMCIHQVGGHFYGDGYQDTFKSSVTITRDYWVDVETTDGNQYTWKNGVDAPYSALTWIAQGDSNKLCAYIGDKNATNPFMLGPENCDNGVHYVACTSHSATYNPPHK